MTWNWVRLRDDVRRLKLPAGEYAIGRIGYGLSRDPSSTADRVELLVTETGWRRLKERAWRERGRETLRHPTDRSLTAHLVSLDTVRHEIRDVDGLPVVAVEPDPPQAPKGILAQAWSSAMACAAFTFVVGAIVYGLAVSYPSPDAGTTWQHFTFNTTEVKATVVRSSETGTCRGAQVWDTSPRIAVTYNWISEGQNILGSYEGCGASTKSPRDIWVTSDGEVASQHSPWFDHFWPALIILIVPWAFLVDPISDRYWRWRRRRTAKAGAQ